MDDRAVESNRLLSEGSSLAESLVGLTGDEAAMRCRAAGFDPSVVSPGVPVTLDLRVRRVRLFVDENGIVTRGHGG